jgi:hypothetical protein
MLASGHPPPGKDRRFTSQFDHLWWCIQSTGNTDTAWAQLRKSPPLSFSEGLTSVTATLGKPLEAALCKERAKEIFLLDNCLKG